MKQNLAHLLGRYSNLLENAGIDQGLAEVELILCYVLDVDRLTLYLKGDKLLREENLRKIDQILQRRATRYPLQYILEEAWFYGRRFIVSPDVMVPTPETELLCETAIRFIRANYISQPRLIDLGVGSGVIAVTLAAELEDCSILALDISPEAIEIARKNATEHACIDRIEFRQSDFFSSVFPEERFHLILANPPYIPEGEYKGLPPEVLADPKISLVAGSEGLDVINVIVRDAPQSLLPGGRIMFEIGHDQADKVAAMTEKDNRYQSIDILKDLNDIERVVILTCERQKE